MRKVVIRKSGDYKRLEVQEFPDLKPGNNEVLVEVKAFGVNYADILIRWGLYESAKQYVGRPITPGFEFSGIVKQPGSGTTKFEVGEKVFGVTLFNAYASEVLVPEDQLYPLPPVMSFEEAAGFPTVFLTAYHALFQNVVVRSGMTALIHSAAGGVGSSLVQLCKVSGIKTIGVVGTSGKVEFLRELGCDEIIDKSKENLWQRVEEIASEGVDLAFDANGGKSLRQSYNHLAPTGKLIAYGAHSFFPKSGGKVNWPKLIWDYCRTPRFNPLRMTSENKSLITFNLSFLFNRKDLLEEGMGTLLKWLNEGKIRPPKVKAYPLQEVGNAHRELESGKSVGKIVIKVK